MMQLWAVEQSLTAKGFNLAVLETQASSFSESEVMDFLCVQNVLLSSCCCISSEINGNKTEHVQAMLITDSMS